MKIWVLVGTTESGDDILLVFKNKPTDYEIDKIFWDIWPEEMEHECILSYRVNEEEIIDN